MAEVFVDRLQAVEGLIVPSFVKDYVGDGHSRTENEDIATTRMVLDSLQVVAHCLLVFLWLEEHYIVVYAALLIRQFDDVDLATEGRRDNGLRVRTEVTTCDRCSAFLINEDWLSNVPKIPDCDLAVGTDRARHSHRLVNSGIVHLALVEAK